MLKGMEDEKVAAGRFKVTSREGFFKEGLRRADYVEEVMPGGYFSLSCTAYYNVKILGEVGKEANDFGENGGCHCEHYIKPGRRDSEYYLLGLGVGRPRHLGHRATKLLKYAQSTEVFHS